MTGTTEIPIVPEDRGMAVMTHLSGLAGYIVPLAGVIVPLIIWNVKKDQPLISAIARQAVLLNLAIFTVFCVAWVLMLTLILIPAVILLYVGLGIAAVALPVYGAMKADKGIFYRYPVVGTNP